jgi:putative hemolysin
MSAKLISKNDLKKAIKIKGIPGDLAALFLMSVLGLNKINKKYAGIAHLSGREFTAAALKTMNINYDFPEKTLDYIPQEGPFILVSNHPTGIADGLLLLHIASSIRPDIKFMANFLIEQIPNIREFIISVNPFESNKNWKSSYSGVRASTDYISSGGGLVIFPSGEVATSYNAGPVRDKKWNTSALKLIKNAKVPVIPVYIHGTNSNFFHWVGKIHPLLRTIRLPKELTNKSGKTFSLRFGKTILPNEAAEFKDALEFGKYLRSRCYALEANIVLPSSHQFPNELTRIALPKNSRLMQKEIKSLDQKNCLFTTGNYSCYLADSKNIPLLLHELGRKREEAFRAVGEGTNKSLDIDTFDTYYKHLLLWDNHKFKLVGAYRLGIGSEIMSSYGVKGFYTQTLYNYEKQMSELLVKSIELGRSFVSLEYQKEALPLMLLIKGLLFSVLKYPEVQYLLGPVSISSWYPKFYRSLMTYYISHTHSDAAISRLIRPNNPFFPDYLRSSADDLLRYKMESVEKFDRFLLRISDNEYRLPTLVKKYIKIGAKIVTYNVDPDFNYSLDGYVLLNLKDVPEHELRSLAKDEKNFDEVLKRFGKGS